MHTADLLTGVAFVILGLGGLLGVWVRPSLRQSLPYRGRFFLGNLPDTPRNRVAASVFLIGAGTYFAVSESLEGTWHRIAFLGFAALCVAYHFARKPAEAGS